MMQKILAGHAAPLLAAIQSQLSEESQVIQSEELPPQGEVDKNVTCFMLLLFSWEREEVIGCICCTKAPLRKQSLRFRHNYCPA